MSKRKESSSTTAKTSKDAKAAKPSSLTLTEMLAEIEKLQTPEDIERSAIKLHKDLLHEWNKGKERDLKDIGILLGGAKVLLTKLTYLPLAHVSSSNTKDLLIARDILEVGARFSVAMCANEKNTKSTPGAIKDFERYISQLKHYYFDMRNLIPQESKNKYEILGMNLLNLLSQYKIADFHRELELFIHPNVDKVMEDPYIKKAVEIEKYIMEGQYNKIYALKEAKDEELKQAGIVSSGFKYFIDHLETTLKEHTTEIADVIGSAYEKLSMQSVMKLLNLKDSNRMGEIIKAQKWEAKEGYVYFHPKRDTFDDGIPAEELTKNALVYAGELDSIV